MNVNRTPISFSQEQSMRFFKSFFLVFFVIIIALTCTIDPVGPVISKPEILVDPQPVTVNIGQAATFGVLASGKKPFIYKWQKNGADISGGTDSIYTTPATSMDDNGSTYRCIVGNSAGADTSSMALLTVNAIKPGIIADPQPDTVYEGQTAIFGVIASGTKPFIYKWQKNGADISGGTDSSYTTPATVMDDSGSTYRCIVGNSAGADTSSVALLTVNTVFKPDITGDPQPATVNPGQTATFGVIASGTKPFIYKWQRNSADISGAIDSSYTTPATVMSDSGSTYRCIVGNIGGNDTSKAAQLIVTVPDTIPPYITLQGDNPLTMGVFELYNEPGYSAFDAVDGDITKLVIVTNLVDNKKLGIYTVKYNVSDAAGNSAQEKTRTVTVADTVAPVITLNGPKIINLSTGYPYKERGATAFDNYDGDITSKIDTTGDSVNTAVADTYFVHYIVSDNSENKSDSMRIVIVGDVPDLTPPIITLNPPNPMNLIIDSPYVEPGATAMDNIDGDITDSLKINSDSINTSIDGTYRVHYNVSDRAGNKDHKIRTVYVGVAGKDSIVIGTGTTIAQSLPVEPYYTYTYSQCIYTMAELNVSKAITIDSIAYYYIGTAWTDNIVVYMGNTTKSSFSSTSDWITLSNLTTVYSGTYSVTTTAGWRKIKLSTPFSYNNVANLVIAVDENTNSYHLQNDSFRCTSKTEYRSLVYYGDSVNPIPSNPPTTTSGSTEFLQRKMYCPNIIIYYH